MVLIVVWMVVHSIKYGLNKKGSLREVRGITCKFVGRFLLIDFCWQCSVISIFINVSCNIYIGICL